MLDQESNSTSSRTDPTQPIEIGLVRLVDLTGHLPIPGSPILGAISKEKTYSYIESVVNYSIESGWNQLLESNWFTTKSTENDVLFIHQSDLRFSILVCLPLIVTEELL